jgi:DNA polymerase-3 subunit delta
MPEITHRGLEKLLAEIEAGTSCSVYLLYGDEFLYKAAFKSLLDALVPAGHQDFNYEPLDGEKVKAHEIIERLNTFPLVPSSKVVAVHGTKVFCALAAADEFLRKSREAYEGRNFKEAGGYLLYVLSLAGVSIDEAADGNWRRVLDKDLVGNLDVAGKDGADTPWVDEVIRFCRQEGMTLAVSQDDAQVLNDAILKGWPETNHLILTSDMVDKRRKLYKTIKKKGGIIDCSVPGGGRTAEKRQQQDALQQHMKAALESAHKTVARGTFEALYEKVGPEMRRFNGELNKLVSFVGSRKEILPSDVEAVSKRTKEDPIYEMTNAIAEREVGKALFYLDNLLKNNLFPLQVLVAATNQIRKLMLARDFSRGRHGGAWRRDLSYAAFQKTVLPQLQKHESDLLAGNAHPYAIYMTLKHSDNYTFEELARALETLLDADLRLKRSGQDSKMVLERAILRICGDSNERTETPSP